MAQYRDILDNFSEKFPLLQRLYDVYQQMPDISKNEENTLRKTAEITVLELIELVVIATRQLKVNKPETLRQATHKLDTLKVFTDMAREVKAINEDKFKEMHESLNAVGSMVGGWLKSANAPKVETATE